MDKQERNALLNELILMLEFLKENPNTGIPYQFHGDRDFNTVIDEKLSQKEQFEIALSLLGVENITCWQNMIILRKRFGDKISISQSFIKDNLYIMKRRHDPELDSLLENICTTANAPKEKSA